MLAKESLRRRSALGVLVALAFIGLACVADVLGDALSVVEALSVSRF